MSKLRELILLLLAGEALPERHRDHSLKGNWQSYRDAHIEPDWLLIYRVAGDELHLVRTGSHADPFDEAAPLEALDLTARRLAVSDLQDVRRPLFFEY